VGIRVTNWRSQFISCQYGLSDSGVLLSAGFNLEISYTKEGASQVKKRSHCCFSKITQTLSSSDATSPTITYKPLGTCLQGTSSSSFFLVPVLLVLFFFFLLLILPFFLSEHVILSYFTEDIVLQMDDKHCKLYALSPSSSSSTFKTISLPEEVSKLQPQNFEIMSIWMPGYFQPKSGYLVIAQASEESTKPLIDVLLLQPVITSASKGSE
jgi:hypothetical protein